MKKNDSDNKILWHRAKYIFYIIWGISLLIIALVMGYYYLIVLPGIEKDKLDYQIKYNEQQALKAQQELQQHQQEQQAVIEQKKIYKLDQQHKLNDCLNRAKEASLQDAYIRCSTEWYTKEQVNNGECRMTMSVEITSKLNKQIQDENNSCYQKYN